MYCIHNFYELIVIKYFQFIKLNDIKIKFHKEVETEFKQNNWRSSEISSC